MASPPISRPIALEVPTAKLDPFVVASGPSIPPIERISLFSEEQGSSSLMSGRLVFRTIKRSKEPVVRVTKDATSSVIPLREARSGITISANTMTSRLPPAMFGLNLANCATTPSSVSTHCRENIALSPLETLGRNSPRFFADLRYSSKNYSTNGILIAATTSRTLQFLFPLS
jgi:hypothetical protein